MPDVVIEKETFTAVVREVFNSIYNFAKSFTIDFCGLTFDLWDLFIAGLVLLVLGLLCWGFGE